MHRFATEGVLRELAGLAAGCVANILVVGNLSVRQREYVVDLVASRRRLDAFYVRSCERLPSQTHVLVVLHDVNTLSEPDQRRLLRWIDDTQPQILSFACEQMYPLVTSGRFLDALFYRLNVVSLMVEKGDVPVGQD